MLVLIALLKFYLKEPGNSIIAVQASPLSTPFRSPVVDHSWTKCDTVLWRDLLHC